ncbi:hypothetical protein Avbf_10568 [Armadillidium vulgare]|nr:hypothetical protein Avbf_10568 [Armadillidium vulgare]
MEKEKKDCFIEDKETLNIRLSPYYNINSPRISRASSSTSDDERKDVTGKCFFTAEKEDFESANGTLNTNCSSTVKSDVLSSSFEYETKDAQTKNVNEPDEHECRDDFYKEQYEKSEEGHAINRNTDFTPSQLSKVQEIVKETRMKLENSKELKPNEIFIQEYDDKLSSCNEEKKFETEVKSGYKTDGKIGVLRTRRVSDSQIFYMENQEGLLDETYGFQNETCQYVDRHYKPATRTPSIRRNQSESDVLWLKEHEDIDNSDNDPSHDIFVPTHRTIFTVSGTNDSFATEVIPTFLPDEDENEGEDEVYEGTEKSLEYTDKDLSCDTLKEDMSLSNDINPDSSQPYESKSIRNQNENDDFDNELSDTQTKILNENRNLSTSSRSITPFRSPPVSPSFINAFCSSFHQNSPPVKSKKRVLEAANETSPTVKTMIDLYNKRITEKQEMLINPFKPGDPFTENKYSNINATNKTDSYDESDLNKGRVLKSRSTSILPTYSSKNCWNIQRSISGTDEILHSSKFYDFESGLPKKTSSPLSFNNSHVNIYGKDATEDLNASTEESLDTGSENRVSSSSFNVESENARTRSSKLRKARNDFLSRGVAPLTSTNRLRDNYDNFSEGISKDNMKNCKKVNNSLSNINISSSAVDSISESSCKDSLNVELRHLPVLRKESFRRQSESCLLDEFSLKSDVLKSASASGIEYESNQIKGRPPSNKENRKSSYDPTDDKRSTKGIFKLFKKSKSRDRKDLTTVQELCKQSLAAVEITSPSRISEASNLEQPSTSYSQNPEALNKVPERVRASKTLPREEAPNEASASTSRSCPSSPVALRKSKTSQWLSVGKNIFKSRSSSPNKRPR